MKNQAMQHAIAKAHKTAEEKNPVSLDHNKRESDRQPAEVKHVQEVADKALQVAAQALHDGVNNVSSISPETPRIVVRKGLRGELYAFFVDSEDRQAGKIELLDVSAKKTEKELVDVSFYKQATKPVETDDEKDTVVKAVSKALNVPRVITRARLVKEGSLGRDDEGKTSTIDIEAFKDKLINALVKAIREA